MTACRRLSVRLEAVPNAWLRHQRAWAGQIGFQFMPELSHVSAELTRLL
jgi:hypothetical protein